MGLPAPGFMENNFRLKMMDQNGESKMMALFGVSILLLLIY